MVNKKILIWMIVMIGLIGIVNATLTSHLQMNDVSSPYTDINGIMNFTVTGSFNTTANGYIEDGMGIDSSTYATNSANHWNWTGGCVNYWIYYEKAQDTTTYMFSGGSGNSKIEHEGADWTKAELTVFDGDTQACSSPTGWMKANAWLMITMCYHGGTDYRLYVNATSACNLTQGAATFITNNEISGAGGNAIDAGRFDELKFFSQALNQSEITNLYLYNSTINTTQPTNFTINATEWWTDEEILIFSAIVNGTRYNTTDGIINTSILTSDTGGYNITVFGQGYYNRTYENRTVTTRLEAVIQNTTSPILSITANDYVGNVLTGGINTTNNYTSGISNSNPYQELAENFINITQTTNSVMFNISDLSYYHRDFGQALSINKNNLTFSINMTPNQLVLNFSGVTLGEIMDEGHNPPRIKSFNGTSLLIVQQNLSEGKIRITFNMDDSTQNWTQYYEYNNDFLNHTNDDLTLIDKTNQRVTWLQIIDEGQREIEDVIIRIRQGTNTTIDTWANTTLIGQRLTDSDGRTTFITDQNTYTCLIISKNGYDEQTICNKLYDRDTTQEAPYVITLGLADNPLNDLARMTCNTNLFRDTNEEIKCKISAWQRSKVEIQTPYREANGWNKTELTEHAWQKYNWYQTLTNGTWYDATSGQNITISIWLDNVFWKNHTIYLNPVDVTNIFEQSNYDAIDKDYLMPIMHIIIILLALGSGLIFTQSKAGYITYQIGIIGMVLVFPSQLIGLALLPIGDWILPYILKRIRGE